MNRKVPAVVLPLALALGLAAIPGTTAAGNILLRVAGAYIAYSYDHNQIFGDRVSFKLGGWDVTSRGIKIDIASRSALAFGGVELIKDAEKQEADEVLFDLPLKSGILLRYGQTIEAVSLETGAPLSDEARQALSARRKPLDDMSLLRIRGSLVSFAAKIVEIGDSLEIRGYEVTLFIEGIESVGFAKFDLSLGEKPKTNGFLLDKIWYTKTQGLFGKASFTLEREKKISSFTQVYYEEHSILKDYVGLPRQFDLQTSTTLGIGKNANVGLSGNYNSTSLWNARVWLDRAWNNDRNKVLVDFTFNRPLQGRNESWLGLQTSFDFQVAGRLAVQARYEVHDQTLASLAYNATIGKRLTLAIQSGYSRILIGGMGSVSKIFTGDANLSYRADLFSLGTDYYLNYDLLGNQRLTRPQLRLAFNPVTFYGGLLTASLQNIFVVNDFARDAVSNRSYSDNIALNLAAAPIYLRENTSIQVNLAFEQFLEKQGRNFTSGGLILRANTRILSALTLEGFYSLQSRRRSKGWLIEGTTSQDLSGVLRFNPGEGLNGWISASFDPKTGEWKQSFADVTVGLIKNWNFQSLLNYDFFRRRIANVDLYLIRHAGRFDLRFIWRSISKQFLIELIPAVGQ